MEDFAETQVDEVQLNLAISVEYQVQIEAWRPHYFQSRAPISWRNAHQQFFEKLEALHKWPFWQNLIDSNIFATIAKVFGFFIA